VKATVFELSQLYSAEKQEPEKQSPLPAEGLPFHDSFRFPNMDKTHFVTVISSQDPLVHIKDETGLWSVGLWTCAKI